MRVLRRLQSSATTIVLLLVLRLASIPSTVAQFGVAGGNRRAGTGFEDLQQRAKQATAAGGQDEMAQLLGDTFNDPALLKQYQDAMAELSQLSPEQLQQQMADALAQLTDGSMMDEIMNQKQAVLANLKGVVSAEEYERYENDDEYFESKMKESFGQMQELFTNEDYLKAATENMAAMAGGGDAGGGDEMLKQMADLTNSLTDEDIETARLQLLKGGDEADSLMTMMNMMGGGGDLFESEEMQAVLHDKKKWRDAVKEGFQTLSASGAGGAAAGKNEL